MKPEIQFAAHTRRIKIESFMSAELSGNVVHHLYSTFWLAKHIEETARIILEPCLEDDEDALGSYLAIEHRAMTPIGDFVIIDGKVVEVKDNVVVCQLTVNNSNGLAAFATQTQIILPKSIIEKKIRNAYSIIN